MDKMQKEFYEWLSVYMPGYELEYSGWIEDMFEAWQASRVALVVQLPETPAASKAYVYSVKVVAALRKAGIKWTE